MKIAILGFSSQGRSALDYWSKPGNEITVCHRHDRVEVPANVRTQFGDDHLKNLDQYDLLIRTPALHPNDIVAANPEAPNILQKVTTVTNEFLHVCPTQNVIGVTGTKGKGTTSTLVTEILRAAGKTVHLGGNIGIPPLDMLKNDIQPNDWVVLELANFQLIDLALSPKIATCLMVVPEHLDWHTDIDEYITTKQQLFVHQTVHDTAIFNRNNAYSKDVASVSPATKISYEVPGPKAEPTATTGAYLKGDTIYMNETEICNVSDIALLGRHNIENVCAAIATTWEIINRNPEIIKRVVQQFAGLPHRLQPLGTVGEVQYFNDSFAATPNAAMAAMNAITGTKVMIMGGVDRGLDLTELVQEIVRHQAELRKVLLIGELKDKLASALTDLSFTNFTVLDATDMPTIVAAAQTEAQPGDAVVLSPGAASFDMFKNFEERGNQFIAAVEAL